MSLVNSLFDVIARRPKADAPISNINQLSFILYHLFGLPRRSSCEAGSLRGGRRPTRQSQTLINNHSSLIIYLACHGLAPAKPGHCEAIKDGRGNLNFIIRHSLFNIGYSLFQHAEDTRVCTEHQSPIGTMKKAKILCVGHTLCGFIHGRRPRWKILSN